MNEVVFLQHIASALDGLEAGSITSNTSVRELPHWDSLALLNVLAMIDAEYNVQLTGTELNSCQTLGDIFSAVGRKLR